VRANKKLSEIIHFYFLQIPQVPLSLWQYLQYLQFLQALQGLAPEQVASLLGTLADKKMNEIKISKRVNERFFIPVFAILLFISHKCNNKVDI
jgi:hypothetical protein